MGHLSNWQAWALFLLLAPLSAEAAPCLPSHESSAEPISLKDSGVAAPLLVNAGIWLAALGDKGFEKDLEATDIGCERTPFEAAGQAYVLGDPAVAIGAVRLARASRRDPLVYLLPIPDLVVAMQPTHTGPAPISGYALIAKSKDLHTIWRIFDGVPSDKVLAAEAADALAGRGHPLMRWSKGGKIEIIVPSADD